MAARSREAQHAKPDTPLLAVSQVPLADVHPAPWNVRTGHAVDAIAESIRINGFRDPIEAWRCSNGHNGEIVAGEGRYHAAVALGLAEVPVIWHDFDSLASAKRYAIANNRLTERSEWDLPALQGQLEELGELGGLDGSGFDDRMLSALVMNNRPGSEVDREDAADHWRGMPEYDEGEVPFRLVVACDTELDRETVVDLLGAREFCSHQCGTVSIRWPLRVREDLGSVQYTG